MFVLFRLNILLMHIFGYLFVYMTTMDRNLAAALATTLWRPSSVNPRQRDSLTARHGDSPQADDQAEQIAQVADNMQSMVRHRVQTPETWHAYTYTR